MQYKYNFNILYYIWWRCETSFVCLDWDTSSGKNDTSEFELRSSMNQQDTRNWRKPRVWMLRWWSSSWDILRLHPLLKTVKYTTLYVPLVMTQIVNWANTVWLYRQALINKRTIVHSKSHFHKPNKRGCWQLLVNAKMPPDKLSRDRWALADYGDLYLFIKQSAAFRRQWLGIQSEL